jgi:Cu/Ag efflux protein CusF
MKNTPHTSPFKPHRSTLGAALTLALLCSAPWAQAQHAGHTPAAEGATASAPSAANPLPWVEAEVRRVDAAAGKLTLRHADIPNLDMPGMTMTFVVADRQWLTGLQPQDQVQVTLDKVQGQYTVTGLRRR